MARAKALLICHLIAALSLLSSSFGQNLIPVTDSTKRLEFQGFAVLPPSGKNWFVVEPSSLPNPSADTVKFAKVVGKMHSVYGMVMLVNPAAPQTLEDLRSQFLEEVRQEPSRFKPVQTEASLAKCYGYDCVRFDLVRQDHAPADFPGAVLIITRRGFVVPHPDAPGFQVWVEWSERFPPGTSRYPVDAELEPFLRGLQFKPIRLTTNFPDDCALPRGENEAFAYGCAQGAYRIRRKKPKPIHVGGKLGWNARALSLSVDAAVTGGPGTEPGQAVLGIGCLTERDRGYFALVNTDGSGWIARLEEGFTPLTAREKVSLPGPRAHLTISCVGGRRKNTTLLTLLVNGQKVTSVEDRRESGLFNSFALYSDGLPSLVVFERFVLDIPPK